MKSWRYLSWGIFIFFSVVLFFYALRPSVDPDFLRHIKLGEFIWNSRQMVRQEPFVFPTLHTPLHSHNWLFDVLIYLVYAAGGFAGVSLFNVAMAFAICYVIFKSLQNKKVFWVLPFFLVYILSSRLFPRPDIFSVLFIAFYIFLLIRDQEKNTGPEGWIGNRAACAILLVHILWVNIHTFYVLGLLLLFLYLGGRVVERSIEEKAEYKWLGLLVLMVAACGLNPDGYKNFEVVLGQAAFASKSSYYSLLDIVELRSPFFFPNPYIKMNYFALIGISALSFVLHYRQTRRVNRFIFIWIFFLLFSFLSLRSMLYFCVLAVPIAGYNLYALKDRVVEKFSRWKHLVTPLRVFFLQYIIAMTLLNAFKLPIIFTAGLIKKEGLAAYFQTMTHHSYNEISEEAIQFIKNKDLPDTILNTYNNGSAIYFYCYPKKVFIDSRGLEGALIKEYVYFLGRDLFNEEDILKYRALLDKYRINTVLQPIVNVSIVRMLYYQKDWQLVYMDRSVYIFCRKSALRHPQDLIARDWPSWASQRAAQVNTRLLSEEEAIESNLYARVLLSLSMFDAARQLFFSGSLVSPWDPSYYYNLALCDYLQKRYADAYAYAYRAYQFDPYNIRQKCMLFLTAQAAGAAGIEQEMRRQIAAFAKNQTAAFDDIVKIYKFSFRIDLAQQLSLPPTVHEKNTVSQ